MIDFKIESVKGDLSMRNDEAETVSHVKHSALSLLGISELPNSWSLLKEGQMLVEFDSVGEAIKPGDVLQLVLTGANDI